VDGGYRGEDKGKDWVEKALGWSVDLLERPRKPAPEEVMKSWAKEWAKEGVAVDWQKFMTPKGFQVLPRRWVVERRFSWIDHNRRMSLGTTRGSDVRAGSVGICCHDSPHAEAFDPPVRAFHTVSLGTLVNKGPG